MTTPPEAGSARLWGGAASLWWHSLLPRLHACLPAPRLLDIGCGEGRLAPFLADLTDELLLVDVDESALAACRRWLASERPGRRCRVLPTNGWSLPGVEDGSVDLVFSFEALVATGEGGIRPLLAEIARVLAPRGLAFLHHSNLAAFLAPGESEPAIGRPHGRAPDVSAERLRAWLPAAGLEPLRQELVDWGSPHLIDAFTLVGRAGARPECEPMVRRHPYLMAEAARALATASFWSLAAAAPAPPVAGSPPEADDLERTQLRSHDEYRDHVARHAGELAARRRRERGLMRDEPFAVEGTCAICDAPVGFQVDPQLLRRYGEERPLWRETLHCPRCELSSRMRAALHLFPAVTGLPPRARLWLAEAWGPLYREFSLRYRVEGSEFLRDGTPEGGVDGAGVRHENVLAPAWPAGSFDAVLSFEVLEHLPDHRPALAAMARVLAPGGVLVVSVPFHAGPRTEVRARQRADGSIEHLLEPDYHVDPLDPAGCLAFRSFGWDLLDDLAAAGLVDPLAHLYASHRFGYLGADRFLFTARRAPAA